jgi:hypothetical protein
MFLWNSVWQTRRVIITKQKITFAFVGEESQIDYIPFAEIISIKEMSDATGDVSDDERFSHAMQIATRDDGHNSGRIYYLSTHSSEALKELMSDLSRKAEVARVHAEARTTFRKFQLQIRTRYESRMFQGLMALLIIAVCADDLRRFNYKLAHHRALIEPPFAAELRLHHFRVRVHLPAHPRRRLTNKHLRPGRKSEPLLHRSLHCRAHNQRARLLVQTLHHRRVEPS